MRKYKIKIILISYISKTLHFIYRFLRLGSGYTWPGHVALTLDPNILSYFDTKFSKGIIIVCGTNGKTTTSKLLTHILSSEGFKVLSNTSGANLLNGIVSHLLLGFGFWGEFVYDFAVLEVDEFALPQVLQHIHPDCLILLNLSRDQLDRYGEIDIIMDKWVDALSHSTLSNTKIIYDADTKIFERLDAIKNLNTSAFEPSYDGLEVSNLKGSFNAKNIGAALNCVSNYGVSNNSALKSIETFDSAYGRGEVIGDFLLYLAKNPSSFNNNLELLKDFDPLNTAILFVLNDNIPDGRDVSWIYDIDPTLLSEISNFKHVYFSGTRYLDIALRASYASINVIPQHTFSSLKSAITQIKNDKDHGNFKKVLVFPNYSAMLEVRKLLIGRSIL